MSGLTWRRVPIPAAFYADETGEPFETCLECNRALRTGGVPYIIEKAVRSYTPYGVRDTVFEYAMCLPCYEGLSAQFSAASRADIEAYMQTAPFRPLARRADWLMEDPPVELDRWMDRCAIKDTPVDTLEEYQLVAVCNSDYLVVSEFPAVFSGAAMDEVAALLSSETLDILGGFRDAHFDLPPDLKKIGPDLVLI